MGATMRTILVLTAMLVSACSAPAPAEVFTAKPDTAATTKHDAGATTVQPVVVEEGDTSSAAPTTSDAILWRGQIATTSPVAFGGGIYCSYSVVLSSIDVTLSLDRQGRVTASTIRNTMTESTPPDCPAAALGVQQNIYGFDATTQKPPVGLTVSLAPDAKNLPLANITLDAEVDDADHMSASIVFQRTGGTDPSLNWKVTTQVQLTQQ